MLREGFTYMDTRQIRLRRRKINWKDSCRPYRDMESVGYVGGRNENEPVERNKTKLFRRSEKTGTAREDEKVMDGMRFSERMRGGASCHKLKLLKFRRDIIMSSSFWCAFSIVKKHQIFRNFCLGVSLKWA